jgi:Transposase DDE domain
MLSVTIQHESLPWVVIADAGHESRTQARQIMRDDGWKLQIVKRRQHAFKIAGLTWIVERSFAWLGRNRRFSKDYEYAVQTSETMIVDIATIRIMLNRLAPASSSLALKFITRLDRSIVYPNPLL